MVPTKGIEIMGATELRLNITGMTCAACATRIEKVLNRLPGVESAAVNLASEQAVVKTNAPLARETVAKAVEGAGYGVRDDAAAAAPDRESWWLLAGALLTLPLVYALGRAYWEYCRTNGFALPGEKGGAAEPILFHDCAHVLSGYGTTPEEEVQVACFSAGFQRRDPFTFVFFVLLQFHVGIRMTPITEARTGFFDPEKALIAIRRGAAMNVDLNNGWDYWPVMGEQVEELRKRYNILPIEAFSRVGQRSVENVA